MAYDIDEIANAVAAALAGLEADGVGVQASAYLLSNPTPTGVYIGDGEIDYDLAMGRGLDRLELVATVLVGYAADIAAQRRLRKLRHPVSGVKALVEADKTLGGLVDHCRVTKASAARMYDAGGKAAVGCEFTVEIHATP